jgi:hypothetical protein
MAQSYRGVSGPSRNSRSLLCPVPDPGILIGPQCLNTGTLERFWRLILWNSLSGEFISIPKEVIGMETACEDKS